MINRNHDPCTLANLDAVRPVDVGTAGEDGGFTLVELLVVVAILGIVITIAIPAYSQIKVSAQNARCIEEMRGIENDINAYTIEHGGELPPNLGAIGRGGMRDPWGNPYRYYNIVANGTAGAYVDITGTEGNSDFDLYSIGPNSDTTKTLADMPLDPLSADDVVRLDEGGFLGVASAFGLP